MLLASENAWDKKTPFAPTSTTTCFSITTTSPIILVMDTILPNAQSSLPLTEMNSEWGSANNNHAATYDSLDFGDADLSMPLGATDENSRYAPCSPVIAIPSVLTSHSLSFADAMSAFTNQEPVDQKPCVPATTIDPMSMWPGPIATCDTPSNTNRHDSAYSDSGTPKSTETVGLEGCGIMPYPSVVGPPPTEIEGFAATVCPNASSPTTATARISHGESPNPQPSAPEPTIQPESISTHRARHAANQRHQKARNLRQKGDGSSSSSSSGSTASTTASTAENTTKAEEKKRTLREKNKVAAAKCRQRQRKQAETIRAKGARLSETNAQLKSYVQELRSELNALRSMALGHGECDARLARYNQMQAERVMAEYYSACGGLAGSMVGGGGGGQRQ